MLPNSRAAVAIAAGQSKRYRRPSGASYHAGTGTRPVVLVIDDDAAVLESLRRLLRAQQMDVIASPGGRDALRHISRPEIDLVITDLRMAPIDGWDLVFHYRIERPGLPILVVSGLPPHASGGAHHLATEYFQKPIDLDALLRSVRSYLTHPKTP